MDEPEIRRLEALGLRQKAERHLDQARTVLPQAAYELALVGAYTAAELIVRALLLLKPNVTMPHTHGGTTQMFGREYIKTGVAPREWGRLLDEKLQLRSGALYDVDTIISREEAESVIGLAQDMLDFLDHQLEETAHGDSN